MFEHTFVHVSYNNNTSLPFKVGNGTRQGGILSTIIFNFYINKAIEKVLNMNSGCFLGLINVSIIGYADDIIIMAPSLSALQTLLNTFVNEVNRLCIQINASKSVYILFKHKKHVINDRNVKISNQTLDSVISCKYLGFNFNDDMSSTNDIERLYVSFLKQFNGIYHKFNFLPSYHCLQMQARTCRG